MRILLRDAVILHLIWNYKTHTPRWSCSLMVAMIYAWQRSPWNHIRFACMYHTETTSEGRLLHDWFTSKHRLISVVSSSPSQAVSPESAVSEELPRFTSTPVNGDMHTCKQGCGTMTKKTIIENQGRQLTPSQCPSSWTAHPNRKHHRGDSAITPNASSQRPSCWQCVQSNPKPSASHAVFYWSFCFPTLPFPAWTCVHSYGLWRRNPDTKPKLRKQPNIRHLNPTMPAYIHPVKLRGITSWPVSKFRSRRIQPWMVRNGSRASLSLPICMENIFGWHSIHHPFPTRRRRNMLTFASMFTTHHSWLYSGASSIPDRCLPETSRKQWNDDFLPTRKARNSNHQVWIHGGNPHCFHMFNSHHRIAVLNKTSMTRGSFVHPHMWTLQTITGSTPLPAFHMLIDRMKNPRPPQAYMTSDRHDGFIPTWHRYAITWQSGNEELANTLVPGQLQW